MTSWPLFQKVSSPSLRGSSGQLLTSQDLTLGQICSHPLPAHPSNDPHAHPTPLSAPSPPAAPNALPFPNVPEVSFHPEYALPSASILLSYPLGVCELMKQYWQPNLQCWFTFSFLFQVDVSCCLVRHVWLFATLWTIAHPAPLSMGFSRQE